MEVRTQLNYVRAFSSAVTFSNRYIYIVGGTTDTECIEVFDSFSENDKQKCDMIMLNLDNYFPWFKEILLPLYRDGIMIFNEDALIDEDQEDSSEEEKEYLE
mmetsp:Transcript_22573/g.21751  ORF Transcript_22573/g.21751 Transcript_22573/m.21751 type:complete len:102 (+) Transcript_22573:919-1224(+)